MASSACLLHQPPEVYHAILLEVRPADLARLSRTCQQLKSYIAHDNLLWKEHYLRQYDSPAFCTDTEASDLSWQARLKDLVSFEKLLESDNVDLRNDDASLELVCQRSLELLTKSTPKPEKNASFLTSHFTNESNISSFLCRSSLFAAARYPSDSPASSPALRQLSAKLFVYYGMDVEPSSTEVSAGNAHSVHPYARSKIYDLRRYNANNMWGPFLDDGSEGADWEKVQCILIDLLYNVRTYTERRSPSSLSASSSSSSSQLWDHPLEGLAPNSYISRSLSGALAPDPNPDLTTQDPYGVTGTWMRIVCFLDYNDLYAFNFESAPIPLSEDRGPIETREAFRLIRLQLRVTGIEYDEKAKGEAKGKPIVHFEGQSKSTYMAWDPNANSRIRGSVRTTPTGDIRWTTFSIFHGEERWRSEGVQIGGIRSARGILGNWFDKDYDVHGPAGPTCFWKVSDDIQEEKKRFDSSGNLWTPPWHEVVNVLFE